MPGLVRGAFKDCKGNEEPMLSSGTHCSWEQQEEASGSQPRFDQGADSGSDISSESTSSEDTQALVALDPPLDATFELANFMRRACLSRSMVQELLDLVHNPFDRSGRRALLTTHTELLLACRDMKACSHSLPALLKHPKGSMV